MRNLVKTILLLFHSSWFFSKYHSKLSFVYNTYLNFSEDIITIITNPLVYCMTIESVRLWSILRHTVTAVTIFHRAYIIQLQGDIQRAKSPFGKCDDVRDDELADRNAYLDMYPYVRYTYEVCYLSQQ